MATPNPVDLVKQAIALDPAQKALSFVDEFRKFALERNVMDLAVGVIIGAAVGKLVESMVKHIMMSLIGTQAAAEPEPATREEALLAEIRDLLKRPA